MAGPYMAFDRACASCCCHTCTRILSFHARSPTDTSKQTEFSAPNSLVWGSLRLAPIIITPDYIISGKSSKVHLLVAKVQKFKISDFKDVFQRFQEISASGVRDFSKWLTPTSGVLASVQL